MLPTIDFTTTQAYKYLTDHYIDIVSQSLKGMFEADSERFAKFSLHFEEILLDYSKNRINDETIALLIQLAKECRLNDTFYGEPPVDGPFGNSHSQACEGRGTHRRK